MSRWLSDKACIVLCAVINQLCVVINQLKEKAKAQKSMYESCGYDPSTGEKLYPSSGPGERQPQKEEVASASTSSKTSGKTESEVDHGSCRVKTSTHRLRPKKNSSKLVNGATGLPLRKGSRVATTTASGETASSILRERIGLDLDWFCFLGFGVGMTIIGDCLGYGISWLLLRLPAGSMERPMLLVGLLCATNWIPMFVISSFMLAWGLYLGMLTNGRRGFVKAFKGWLVTTIITIAFLFCIKVVQLYDGQEEIDRWQRSLLKELNISTRQHSHKELLNVRLSQADDEE